MKVDTSENVNNMEKTDNSPRSSILSKAKVEFSVKMSPGTKPKSPHGEDSIGVKEIVQAFETGSIPMDERASELDDNSITGEDAGPREVGLKFHHLFFFFQLLLLAV